MSSAPDMVRPEIGKTFVADGIKTNYHDTGEGRPVLLVHGSGPGVTAWANWRLNMPEIAKAFRAIAPDMRSEEHTYELQSLMRISYAVFCLKQKNILTKHMTTDLHTIPITTNHP